MDSKIEHDGVRLRNYRVMKNITLTKAATLCGVSKSELSKLESGARPIRPDHVIKLAGVYGTTPLDLLTPDSRGFNGLMLHFMQARPDRQLGSVACTFQGQPPY
jgi:transcriptional regulator with XRE-family HTH domain